eukprot:m.252471 g.252471  ORF g.252471 m.252471 type:complete len:79 (-) comp15473_c2_seq12:125-361(-)
MHTCTFLVVSVSTTAAITLSFSAMLCVERSVAVRRDVVGGGSVQSTVRTIGSGHQCVVHVRENAANSSRIQIVVCFLD